jgi:DNA-binding beta-propeller fold protein YncE
MMRTIIQYASVRLGAAGRFRASICVFAFALAGVFALAGCGRVSRSAAAAAQLPPLQYVGAWGTRGAGPGQLDTPIGIATDPFGRVYIVDAGTSSIEKFTAEGVPLLSFGDAALAKATAIAVDRGGGIYVTEGDRVQIFLPEGDKFRISRGGLQGAAGVAVDFDGTYYVTDRVLCRVVAFDARGRLARTWGRRGTGDGEFIDPTGVAASSDGFVYVADSSGARVQKFTREGIWVASFGQADAAGSAQAVVSLAISSGDILVVGGRASTLRVWSSNGQDVAVDPVAAAATPQGSPDIRAVALAVDPAGDLLLLDAASDRVLRFHLHL